MKMIWHIVKKDLRALWPLWLAWMGLIAVKIFLLYYFLNFADSRAFSLMPMITGFGFLTDIILVASLVQSLVHEDGLVGDKVAWVTRPISGCQLLVAKLLGALILCVVSPLCLLVPTWLVFGCNGTDMAHVLVYHGVLNGSVMLAAFAFAVITPRGNSFWLVVVASVTVAALIAVGVEEGFRSNLMHLSDKKLYWFVLLVVVAFVLLGIVWQYLKRRVWVARTVFSVMVLVLGVLLPSSSGKSFFKQERSYKTDIISKASWLEAKRVASAKGRSYVEGVVEVVTPEQNLTPRMRYNNGVWIDANGRTERAFWVNNQAREEEIVSIRPVKVLTSPEQTRFKFPVSLSVPRFDDEQPVGQVGFSGRLAIAYWLTTKLAEAELAESESVRSASFFARVVSVQTYENAIEIKTVEAGIGNAFWSVTVEISNEMPSDWRKKEWNGGNSGMLLWVSIRSHQSTFVTYKDMVNPNWSAKDRGAPTQENLREKHWRILWKHEELAGSSLCELKADQLTIANATGK